MALTPYNGTLHVTAPNTVVDGLDVDGCIQVETTGVTIQNTRVRYGITGGDCHQTMIKNDAGQPLLVRDVTLDGTNAPVKNCAEMVGYSNYTLLRVNGSGCSDGPRFSGSGQVTIEDSWIHDAYAFEDDHGDGMQSDHATGPVTLRHNTIGSNFLNAAVMLAGWSSGPALIENNLLAGGGFTLRLYDNQATVRGNRFVAGSWQYQPVGPYCDGPKGGNPEPGCHVVEWDDNAVLASDGTLTPIPAP